MLIVYSKCMRCGLIKIRKFKNENNYNKGYGNALRSGTKFSMEHPGHPTKEYIFIGLLGQLHFNFMRLFKLL